MLYDIYKKIEMRLYLFVFCFVFALLYSGTTTAQEVQVCVSYGGSELGELFINVNWNFPDSEVNIMFEDINGITSGVYNESSAVDIPMRLRADQDTVNVTVCLPCNTLCYSVITVTDPIYNATWTRVNDRTLEFTCEVACRTPAITGCTINLVNSNGNSDVISGTSFNVNRSDEDISARFVTILVTDVDPTVEWTFTATPVAIINGVVIALNGFMGIVPAAVEVSTVVEIATRILSSSKEVSTSSATKVSTSSSSATKVSTSSSSATKISTSSSSVLSTHTISSSITLKSTPNTPTSYKSSSSLSTAAVVTITVLITMVISIALTTIVMLIIFKLYLLKRSQHSQHVHPPKTEVPSLKIKDIKEESNPAYKITEDDDSHGDAYELYY